MLLWHNIVGITLAVSEDLGDSSVEIWELLNCKVTLSFLLNVFVLFVVQVGCFRGGIIAVLFIFGGHASCYLLLVELVLSLVVILNLTLCLLIKLIQNSLKLEHVVWIAKVRSLLRITKVFLMNVRVAGRLVLGGRLLNDRLYHARIPYLRWYYEVYRW